MSVEAPVLPCRGCGAPLAIHPSSAEAACPRCKTVTTVPGELRHRAAVYESSLGAERRKVEFARNFGKTPYDKMGKYFGPPFAVLLGGFTIAMVVLDPDDQRIALYGFMGGMALIGVAFFVWLKVATTREITKGAEPPPVVAEIFEGSVTGTCSTCGGRVPFAVEQASARCPYCGATVFPTQTDQAALLRIAGEHADLESARATRKITRDLAKAFDGGSVSTALGWMRWLPFLMMPVVLVGVGGTLAFGNGVPDPTNLEGVTLIGVGLMGGGLVLLVLVVGGAMLLGRFRGGDPIARACGGIAHTFGGAVQPGVKPLLDWLDAHWAAAVPAGVLDVGASDQGVRIVRRSVAFAFMGRPAMIAVADAPHLRRTDLFLSSYRRRAEGEGAQTQAAHEVHGAGFAPLVSNAGVHLARPASDATALSPQNVKWLLERAGMVAKG